MFSNITPRMLPIELAWPVAGNTGWGLYGLHFALAFARLGRRVYLPGADLNTIPGTLRPTIAAMCQPGDVSERRIRFEPYGNHAPPFQPIANRVRCLLAVFEDTTAVRPDIMRQYDLVLAPSLWIQGLLTAQGIESTLFYQGVDLSVFHPAPRRRPADSPFYVFSGGKLEYRKGQDIVVEAFRRFRETPEGKDAVLVTAWQNLWPSTMEGIWLSGYVKGIPAFRAGQLDIVSWCEANGVPQGSVIDLGMLSQGELANAMRECDCAIFPNRAEGATNMQLVEALTCGIPSIIGGWTGQRDVLRVGHGWLLSEQDSSPATHECALYGGTEGWREAGISECVNALQRLRTARTDPGNVSERFTWDGNVAGLAYTLAARFDEATVG